MSFSIACPVNEERKRLLKRVISPMAMARVVLQDPDTNLFSIDGKFLDLPQENWGRDFEVRLFLDVRDPSTIGKFIRALPKRFERTRSFWGEYVDIVNKNFCEVFKVRYSQVRFSQISKDQCVLFHSDNIMVRLFQTLQGLGTEYILDDNLNRNGIGEGCNSKIVVDFDKVQKAKEKDILLMRGDKWFGCKGFVHRSPPIEFLGLKRLYFCLDVVNDLSSSHPES